MSANHLQTEQFCLEVSDLSVAIRNTDHAGSRVSPVEQEMVSGVGFTIKHGETLGLVGESGCGKSLTAMSLAGLLPHPQVRRRSGRVVIDGVDISDFDNRALPALRGKKIGVIFQDPMTALNPVHRAGRQIDEVLGRHFPSMNRQQRRQRCLALLRDVGIPAPEQRIDAYPHQLSGGMRQRLMIAMALAGEPALLIADEPTTALDVTIQAQIVAMLKRLQRQRGMAMLFITHDLGLVSQVSDRIAVMYAGKIVEIQAAAALFRQPLHPYTRGLLAALPGARTRAPKSRLDALAGQVPSVDAMPEGCCFANRCPHAVDKCVSLPPTMENLANTDGDQIACHRWQALAGEQHND